MTKPGVVLGTLAYMSPEQALGRPLDARTDIFSLGAVLYELVTGRRPHEGSTPVDLMHSIVHSNPRPLCEAAQSMPPELEWILDKALAKDLRERYQAMSEFAADLRKLRRRLQSGGVPEILPARRRREWLYAAGGATAACAVIVLLWLSSFTREPVKPSVPLQKPETTITQLTSYTGTEHSGAISPDGRHFAFVSERRGNPDIWVRQISGGEPVQITQDEALETDLVYAPDGESIYFAALPRGDRQTHLLLNSQGVESAIWNVSALGGTRRRLLDRGRHPCPSSDGKELAYVRNRSEDGTPILTPATIEIANADGSGSRVVYEGRGIGQIGWSPDKRWLSFTEGSMLESRNLQILDTGTRSKRAVTDPGAGSIRSHAWLGDSRRLLVSRSHDSFPLALKADLEIISIAGEQPRRLTLSVNSRFVSPSLSASGGRLLATMETLEQEIWRVPLGPDPKTNGTSASRLLDNSWGPFFTHVSQDGSMVLFNGRATGRRNLWTILTDGSAPSRQITAFPGDVVTQAALSPDLTRVSYASRQTGNSEIWVANIDGSNPQRLTDAPSEDFFPTWSPDSKWIAFGSLRTGRPELWRVPSSGGEALQITQNGGTRGDWSPVDSRIVYLAPTGLEVADVNSGSVQLSVQIQGLTWSLPAWSPDGRQFSAIRTGSAISDSIWIFDAQTGQAREAAKFPGRFHMIFRAGWTDDGRSLIVNRNEIVSHIVLLENF
jgi:Tol biopolymer transport system component